MWGICLVGTLSPRPCNYSNRKWRIFKIFEKVRGRNLQITLKWWSEFLRKELPKIKRFKGLCETWNFKIISPTGLLSNIFTTYWYLKFSALRKMDEVTDMEESGEYGKFFEMGGRRKVGLEYYTIYQLCYLTFSFNICILSSYDKTCSLTFRYLKFKSQSFQILIFELLDLLCCLQTLYHLIICFS